MRALLYWITARLPPSLEDVPPAVDSRIRVRGWLVLGAVIMSIGGTALACWAARAGWLAGGLISVTIGITILSLYRFFFSQESLATEPPSRRTLAHLASFGIRLSFFGIFAIVVAQPWGVLLSLGSGLPEAKPQYLSVMLSQAGGVRVFVLCVVGLVMLVPLLLQDRLSFRSDRAARLRQCVQEDYRRFMAECETIWQDAGYEGRVYRAEFADPPFNTKRFVKDPLPQPKMSLHSALQGYLGKS